MSNSKKRYEKRERADHKTWTMDEQFRRHDPKNDRSAAYDRRLVNAQTLQPITPDDKVLGMNQFGAPEGFFVYGNDRTTQVEFAVDLDLQRIVEGTSDTIKCVGLQLLCPRCGSPLYIRGKGLPGGREIVVHFKDMVQSTVDGKYRPTVSIDGPFGCDYSNAEVTGIAQSRSANVINNCGWRGGITKGRCLDHLVARGTA